MFRNYFLPVRDPALDIVNWLMARTQRGRVEWEIRPAFVTTVFSNQHVVQFATARNASGSSTWHHFSLYDTRGNEVLRVLPYATSPCTPQLIAALHALFLIVTKPLCSVPPA